MTLFELWFSQGICPVVGLLGHMVILFLVIFNRRIRKAPRLAQVGVALLVGGALGNAYDRWAYNAVIDFFDFRIWPIFNVADIAICIGAGLLILDTVRRDKKAKAGNK